MIKLSIAGGQGAPPVCESRETIVFFPNSEYLALESESAVWPLSQRGSCPSNPPPQSRDRAVIRLPHCALLVMPTAYFQCERKRLTALSVSFISLRLCWVFLAAHTFL